MDKLLSWLVRHHVWYSTSFLAGGWYDTCYICGKSFTASFSVNNLQYKDERFILITNDFPAKAIKRKSVRVCCKAGATVVAEATYPPSATSVNGSVKYFWVSNVKDGRRITIGCCRNLWCLLRLMQTSKIGWKCKVWACKNFNLSRILLNRTIYSFCPTYFLNILWAIYKTFLRLKYTHWTRKDFKLYVLVISIKFSKNANDKNTRIHLLKIFHIFVKMSALTKPSLFSTFNFASILKIKYARNLTDLLR